MHSVYRQVLNTSRRRLPGSKTVYRQAIERRWNTSSANMPARKEPKEGTEATATTVVEEQDLASSLPLSAEDNYPPVWATAKMIALMEIASARILAPCANQGELSVGVDVHATHSAPTPLGQKVWATARYVGREGKLYKFDVTANDSGGQVGHAQHTRAIVKNEKIQSTAKSRCGGKL